MIRFRRIEINNFVCFRHLVITPSTDPERPLTVIRAENGSGKTTLQRAISWGMYGEQGLPPESQNFGIHLAEWEPDKEGMTTQIQIEFENDGTSRANEHSTRELKTYQLIRKVTTVKSDSPYPNQPNFRRVEEWKELMVRFDNGDWKRHEFGVDAVVNELLPLDLRDFFVMDADQVVDFVGGSENKHIKRGDVITKTTKAMHSLLGIDAFRSAAERLARLARDFGASATKAVGRSDMFELQEKYDRLTNERDDIQEQLRQNRRNKSEAEGQRQDCEDQIGEQISSVAKFESIAKSRNKILESLPRLSHDLEESRGRLRLMLESKDLLAALAIKAITPAYEYLRPLHEQGKIPQRHLAFVEEILRKGECVCGQDLLGDNRFRTTVKKKLNEAKLEQQHADFLGNLYEAVESMIDSSQAVRWTDSRVARSREVAEFSQQVESLKREKDEIEQQMERVDSAVIQQLQAEKGILDKRLEEFNQQIGQANARLEVLEKDLRSIESTLDQRKRNEGAAKEGREAERLAKLVGEALAGAYGRILSDQVDELSKRMNGLFLQMAENVREDEISEMSERRATLKMITEVGLQRVEEESFEIYALNRHGRHMPPTEINGASRRVIALAFVLALCKESRANAPLVADSLLNFMSGTVRTNTLQITSRYSSQPILLLTGSDLESPSEVETVSRHAGVTYTLTAQWHAREAGQGGDIIRQTEPGLISLLCECGPREYCDMCERQGQATSVGWNKRITQG